MKKELRQKKVKNVESHQLFKFVIRIIGLKVLDIEKR